ncbi:pilus assembly protein [Pantoea sp. 18069]|uniref:pilus assembly protein n=1 Tax=Pantoea sp. 18069 TaxID=2681415 RepID=UPI00135CD85E|nr:PilC/PilY family type IV pilus protein [Pantoea sp. 18069]
MNKTSLWRHGALLAAAGAALHAPPALAAQWSLVQYPAGTASREPAPNVIVSVDDSGSMGAAGITTLKAALRQTFSSENVADGLIRLGWQSMNSSCNTIPLDTTACRNGIKVLKGTHRSNFLTWVDTLKHEGGTPSHRMVRNAGDYLKRTDLGINSPWASDPGVTAQPVIACRRSYHIFMTDGAWNSGTAVVASHVDADRSMAGYRATELTTNGIGNLDDTTITLGDGITPYNPAAVTSRIYRDAWGFNTTYNSNRTVNSYGLNTLSDLAFHYWATDLQPGIANELKPLIKKSGDETFTSVTGSSTKTTTLPQFWNPKNNPATWQHMTTYTIGFGSGASAWSGEPRFGTSKTADDNYTGDFNRLVTGDTNWPSPLCGNNNTGSGNNACDGSTGYSATAKDNGRRIELWHMALNGRGKFTPAPTADDLTRAFKDIVSTIVEDTSTPITSFASSSSSVTRADTSQYSSGYNADGWTGYVRSDTLAQGTAVATPNTAWGLKAGGTANAMTTADKLDALSAGAINNRLILTTAIAANNAQTPVAFTWANLGATQKDALKVTTAETDATATTRVNFLRGDRSLEGGTTAKPLRQRNSRQGDIVNSALWYVGPPVSNHAFDGYRAFSARQAARLPMVYVGGNDGMLHGFSALDGAEKIAYVPKGVYANLKELTLPSYTHRYYVDGSPFSGDVNLGTSTTPNWRSMLVGTLGAGGKGYFVLDITTPGSTVTTGPTAVPSNFSAGNAASLVVMDKTAGAGDATTGEAADIGHIFATPTVEDSNPQKSSQVVRLNNGRWAVVMGNGYNSHNERPVLLIQYLDGAKELKTLVAAASGDNAVSNGLSAPRLVDLNSDGMPDLVYAGDLRGNLWKFDIGAAEPALWNTAFNGRPLYSAVYTSGNASSVQPITTAPVVKLNDRDGLGLMVAFGTGRNITEGDRTDVSVQTLYSLLDSTVYAFGDDGKLTVDPAQGVAQPVGTGFADLAQQTVSSTAIAGAGASSARTFFTVSQNTVSYSGSGARKGWYLHLPVTGERLLSSLSFFDGSNILEVLTEVPGSGSSLLEESCSPPATVPQLFRTFLNIMDGRKPSVQLIDTNGDGIYNSTSDRGASRMTASVKESRASSRSKEIRTGSDGIIDELNKLPEQPLRPSWRQLR